MTGYRAKHPAWGVLVEAPSERVIELLEPLRLRFDLGSFVVHTVGGWTAVFNMEPGDTADDEAAELLRLDGILPVYRFDFSKYEYLTFRWDGEHWHRDRDPAYVLGERGIDIPGWESEQPPVPHPSADAFSRSASVIEGATIDEARSLALDLDEHLRVDEGPVGAIVYDPDVQAQMRLWLAPQRVFEILFYPQSGNFRLRIIKGAACLGTFKPGETRSWDGTPFLADFDGETQPDRIVDSLGIDRSFLGRGEST